MASIGNKQYGQHKRLAMGESLGLARGGQVLRTGIPTSPLTDAKRANGIPDFKKGGRAGKKASKK